jgi:hypothetical protein
MNNHLIYRRQYKWGATGITQNNNKLKVSKTTKKMMKGAKKNNTFNRKTAKAKKINKSCFLSHKLFCGFYF